MKTKAVGPLIDKAEASRMTGIPVSTFDHWARTNTFPCVQPVPGGKVYFSAELIQQLVADAKGGERQ